MVLPPKSGPPASMGINLNCLTQQYHDTLNLNPANLSRCIHAQVAEVAKTLGQPIGPPFDTKSSYPEMCLEGGLNEYPLKKQITPDYSTNSESCWGIISYI